ncbi:cold-shock protein, partial [Mycobacterium tuberculosis]
MAAAAGPGHRKAVHRTQKKRK